MRTVIITTIGSFSADIVIKKCRKDGIRVMGCDVHPRGWIVDVRNVEAFYQVPYTTDTDHHIGTIVSLHRREGVEAVIPLTDAEIDAPNPHRDEFSEINVTLCMSDKAYIGLCRNKMELYRYLEEHMGGTVIPAPRLGDADPDETRYPAVCKPCSGRSSQSLKTVGSRREVEEVPGETDPADYTIQPMIKRNIVTVDMVRNPGQGTCAAICRGELLRTPNGAGASVLVFRNRQLEGRCRAIAGLLGVGECVNMEFVGDQDGVYHTLEYNPRFSGGAEFSCLAGYDCVTNRLRCFEGKEIECDGNVTGMYITRKYEEYITRVER